MNIITMKQEVTEIVGSPEALVETAGRICYLSEPKSETRNRFIEKRIESGHTSIIEHAWFYLSEWDVQSVLKVDQLKFFYGERGVFLDVALGKVWVNARAILNMLTHPYIKSSAYRLFKRVVEEHPTFFRSVVIEEDWKMFDGTNVLHGGDSAVMRVTTSRDISHQIVRHRTLSVSQESQRYVNYAKTGYEIVVDDEELKDRFAFTQVMSNIFQTYENLIESGCKPEVARLVLPNCTKTTLILSAPYFIWEKYFALRCDSHAQPSHRHLAELIKSHI